MNKTEVENELLKYFLECLEAGTTSYIEVLVQELENADEDLFRRTADGLTTKGLLKI